MNVEPLLKRYERIATKTMGETWGMSPTLHTPHAPAIIATLGERASYRFFEFFSANIRNPNTRGAYARAAVKFFDWLAARGVTQITAVESVRLAAYIE